MSATRPRTAIGNDPGPQATFDATCQRWSVLTIQREISVAPCREISLDDRTVIEENLLRRVSDSRPAKTTDIGAVGLSPIRLSESLQPLKCETPTGYRLSA